MQYAEPVPADVRLHRTHSDCRLCSEGKHGGSVGARKRGLADDDEKPLCSFHRFEEGVCDLRQCLGAGAKMLIGVGQVCLRPDQADGKPSLRLTKAI